MGMVNQLAALVGHGGRGGATATTRKSVYQRKSNVYVSNRHTHARINEDEASSAADVHAAATSDGSQFADQEDNLKDF